MATGVWVRRLWSGCSSRSADCFRRTATAAASERTLLVVDDDPDVLDLARELLQRAGFRVLAADGGARAVEIFRSHLREIDCVVLDLHMPEVDGDAAFREIRRLRADARVVIVSGYPERMAAQQFEAMDRADGYLSKPYLPDALIEQVRGVLAA